MKHKTLLIAVATLASLVYQSPSRALSIYNDREQFIAAAGPGLQFEDFLDIPLGIDGVAAFSNGALFGDGAFAIESLTFDTDVQLTASGLMGTFLIGPKSDHPDIDRQLLPGGGGGASDPGDDDDIRITFPQPVKAFGMLLIENLTEPNERISLTAEGGRELISLPLPGGSSGGGSNHFMGFVASGELDYIQSITVEEGQVLNDDIGFTWFYFEPASEVVPLDGDLNGDGFVGIADLNMILASWNLSVPAGDTVDPSEDGYVGIDDLTIILGNWNNGSPPTDVTNIPEPSCITLMLGGALALHLRRRSA